MMYNLKRREYYIRLVKNGKAPGLGFKKIYQHRKCILLLAPSFYVQHFYRDDYPKP